jgi:hypothetical protein
MLLSLSFLSQQFFWETSPPYFISVPLKLCILALKFANLNEFIPSYQYYRLSLKAGYIFLAHSYKLFQFLSYLINKLATINLMSSSCAMPNNFDFEFLKLGYCIDKDFQTFDLFLYCQQFNN